LTDWLAVCRAAADDVRAALAELPTRADREPVVGAGMGGDDTVAVDAAAERVVVERLRATGELGATKLLGVHSHVDVDSKRRAQEAGFDLVVPRSRMAREGPALVERLAST
jgi:hypothetical protein